jgi:menaquinone-9 beta-reductase
MHFLPDETDVFIAGGGPAGLAAAIAARLKGFRVAVADPSRPPIDKACGEGLMPEGVAALGELGVPVDATLGAIFRGIRFLEPGSSVQAEFPIGYGIGMRRRRLHQLLIDRAAELGVIPAWGAAVRGLDEHGVIVDGQTIRSRWIVGADGQNSSIRNWAGLNSSRSSPRRLGFRRHFHLQPWSDHVEVHWADRCQAYVTPVSADEVCVALISRDPQLRFDRIYAAFPDMARRLGAVTATRRFKSVVRGRVALIGDAAGSVDAITGEGMAIAFRQALALGEAFAAGDLSLYQAALRRILRRPAFMARLTLEMDRHPWLRHRVLRAFADEPGLFSRMLAFHVRALGLGEEGSVALGW